MTGQAIPALTSLRFFAAAVVVIFHYERTRDVFPEFLWRFGYEAVTFFFVLSGFILTLTREPLTGSLPVSPVETRQFWLARAARILPAYCVGLLISLPFFVYSHLVVGSLDLGTFLAACVLVPLMAQAWYLPTALVWNTPGWSLSVEAFFYAVYPALHGWVSRIGRLALLALSIGLLIGVEWLRLWLMAHAGKFGLPGYVPLLYLPQFICGIALARLFAGARRAAAMHEVMLVLALFAVVVVMHLKPTHGWLASNLVLVPLFGFLIFGAAGADGPLSRMLSLRPMIVLGEASYALYILHWPLAMWWQRVTQRLLGVTLPPAVDFVLYFSGIVLASVAVLYLVEKPGRRLIAALATRR